MITVTISDNQLGKREVVSIFESDLVKDGILPQLFAISVNRALSRFMQPYREIRQERDRARKRKGGK